MDPTACLRRLLDALNDLDRDEALDALDDLREWLGRGGALPRVEADPVAWPPTFRLPLSLRSDS